MGNFISPLRRAIRDRDAKKVEHLLKEAGQGAPDMINEDYTADCFLACMVRNTKSPLHTAMTLQVWDIVCILLKYGADPECPGVWNQTALHIACRQNNLNLVKHLLEEYHADVDALDEFGQRPLHSSCLSPHAIYGEDISVLKYFHEIGKLQPTELMLTDDRGNTPLHTAASHSHVTAVKYLLSLHADVKLVNENGETPYEVAHETCKEAFQVLVEK